ncbi:MAG: hypothetical protein JXB10_02725 [Pirellulales bacterium]|nr:hypothetical protein [Pirellulales bacterium]
MFLKLVRMDYQPLEIIIAFLITLTVGIHYESRLCLVYGEEPSSGAAQKDVKNLLRQLTSFEYQDYQSAWEELLKIGPSAFPLLKELPKRTNAEVQRRVDRLCVVYKNRESAVQISSFLSGTEGKHVHDFSAWNYYRRVVGEHEAARSVFVAILKAEPELCAAIGNDPDALNEQLKQRIMVLMNETFGGRKWIHKGNLRIKPANAAGILLAASDPNLKPEGFGITCISHILEDANYDQELKKIDAQRDVFMKLLVLWLEKDDGASGSGIRLMYAMRYHLKDLQVKLAIEILKHAQINQYRNVIPPSRFHPNNNIDALSEIEFSIAQMGILGKKENIPLIAPYLNDPRTRDLALGTIIELNGQNPKEYDLEVFESICQMRGHPNIRSFRFDTLAQRNQGFLRCIKNYKALGLEEPPYYKQEKPPKFVFLQPMKKIKYGLLGKVRLELHDNQAQLIDIHSGKPIGKKLDAGKIPFTCWSFSPDGTKLVTGAGTEDAENSFGKIQVWEAYSGELITSYPTGCVHSVVFGNDGKTIIYEASSYRIDGP